MMPTGQNVDNDGDRRNNYYTEGMPGHYTGGPGLAGCFPDFASPFVPFLCVLLGQTKTFHIISNTIPPYWQTSPLYKSGVHNSRRWC